MNKLWFAPLLTGAVVTGILAALLLPGETTFMGGIFLAGVAVVMALLGVFARRREPSSTTQPAIPWLIVALVVAGLVVGSRQANIALLEMGVSGPSRLEEQAKDEVASTLRDPESAIFTNLTSAGPLVCGEVNGRNGFGAYAGARRFIWQEGSGPELEDVRSTEPNEANKLKTCLFEKAWTECNKLPIAPDSDCLSALPGLTATGQ